MASDSHHHSTDHHGHHHQGHDHANDAMLAELLDLDAEVLRGFLDEVVDWVHGRTGDLAGGRILDVGSGTGTGTLALARRFTAAEVIALDVSDEMLDRLRRAAGRAGVGDRVRPLRADLDHDWPATGPADLAWASNSLHHMADPDRAFAEIFAALRPGGLAAVLELDSFPRFLRDDDGLEDRVHAVVSEQRAQDMPHLGAGDWGDRLRKAGFVVEAERTFVIDLVAPLPEATGRYAQASLRQLRHGLGDRIGAADRAALDELIGDGPGSVVRRADLGVRARRSAWAARRP
jgi:SAM-dependent methyltransferase